MKSVKSKIIMLVLGSVVISSVAIGVVSYLNSRNVVHGDSIRMMNLLCDNRSENFNEKFKRVEQAVGTLAKYVNEEEPVIGGLENQAQIDAFCEKMIPLAIASAKGAEGVITVYLRYDVSYASPTSGFFYHLDKKGNYNPLATTDLSKYDVDDMEHVGWFYDAKYKGKAVWMAPYYNANIEKEIISYVVPLYEGSTFIGVVGMDIDFEDLKTIVAGTSIYDSGYAFLCDEQANIVYHKDLPTQTNLVRYNDGEFKDMAISLIKLEDDENDLIEYKYEGIEKEATFRNLENNMRFVLTAPISEIEQQSQKLLQQMLIGGAIILLVTITLSIVFASRLTRPLLELTEAAKKIANGDLSVSITHQSKDEVGELAESFRHTIVHLKEYFQYVNHLAYIDSLTGTKNRRAFIEIMESINDCIQEHANTVTFSIVVFDLNDLKIINDTAGHDEGDVCIVKAATLIKEVFKRYPIYRIGGDEFTVLMEDGTYQKHEDMVEKFMVEVMKMQDNEHLSMAWGMASYDPKQHQNFQDVFKQADLAMYDCKTKIKNSK